MATLLNKGVHPFCGSHDHEADVKRRVLKGELGLNKLVCSKQAMSFLVGLLHHFPAERLDASQALMHPWMRLAVGEDAKTALFDMIVNERKIASALKVVTLMAMLRKKTRDLQKECFSQKVKENKINPRPLSTEMIETQKLDIRVSQKDRTVDTSPCSSIDRLRSSLVSSKKKFTALKERQSCQESPEKKQNNILQDLRGLVKAKQVMMALFEGRKDPPHFQAGRVAPNTLDSPGSLTVKRRVNEMVRSSVKVVSCQSEIMGTEGKNKAQVPSNIRTRI